MIKSYINIPSWDLLLVFLQTALALGVLAVIKKRKLGGY